MQRRLLLAGALMLLVGCGRSSPPEPTKIGKANDLASGAGEKGEDKAGDKDKADPDAWARVRAKELVASLAAGDPLWTKVTPEPQEKIISPCAAPDFVKIKEGGAGASTHRKGEMFLTFVRNGAADPYRTHAAMPDGAALIKRTFLPRKKGADDGEITAYFLMVKAAGKNPTGGDWIYATTDGQGAPLEAGPLKACAECHQTQAANDWIFGPR
ncbi:MAG: cytochrome P460 family protein [Polyangiales bacterium]